MERNERIAVIGAKGGCGVTMLAANLAAASPPDRAACVIDLDCGKGDVAAMFDLTLTLTAPLLFAQDFDAPLLRGSATRHPSGFYVIGQPQDMARLVRPLASEVVRMLDVAAKAWSTVFVDCGSRVDEAVLAALGNVDRVLVVATPDVLAVRNAVRLRDLLRRLHVDDSHVQLVLNRVSRNPQLSTTEVEELTRMNVLATVSRDDVVAERCLSEGRLFREAAPRAAIVEDLENLWRRLCGEPPVARAWRLVWAGGAA